MSSSTTNDSKIDTDWMHYATDKVPHHCERAGDLDDLNVVYPGNSWRSKFRRHFRQLFICPHRNVRAFRLFRSHANIDFERSRQLRLYWYMIHPFSYFMIFVDIVMILSSIIALSISLWIAAFDHQEFEPKVKLVLNLFILIGQATTIAFIAINFFTGVVENQTRRVEMRLRNVAKLYLSGYFIVDLISVAGIAITHLVYIYHKRDFKKVSNPVRLLLFLASGCRIIRIMTQIKHTAEALNISHEKGFYIWALAGLVSYFHFTACFCFFVSAAFDDGGERSWLKKAKALESSDLMYMYQTGLDRSVWQTLGLCIKYPATSTADQLMTIVLTWTGAIFFLVIVGKIMQLTTARNSSVSHYENVVTQVKQYMDSRQLPHKLQGRVLEFYYFRYQGAFFNETRIVHDISRQLRQDYRFHQCQDLVEKVSFFEALPAHVLVRIVAVLQTEFFLHGETVIRLNTVGSAMYFIKSGTVAVYTSQGEEVCHLEDGNHFGEITLVIDNIRRVAQVVTLENCELYRLERADFNAVMSPFPLLLKKVRDTALRRLESVVMLEASHHQINVDEDTDD